MLAMEPKAVLGFGQKSCGHKMCMFTCLQSVYVVKRSYETLSLYLSLTFFAYAYFFLQIFV